MLPTRLPVQPPDLSHTDDLASPEPVDEIPFVVDGVTWTHVGVDIGQHWAYWHAGSEILRDDATAELDALSATEERTDPTPDPGA